jgi:protein tyrosine/serine phosphatase
MTSPAASDWVKRRHPLRIAAARLSDRLKRARGAMDTPWRRLLGAVEALFVDHAVFRVVYANRFRVSERVWRSSQPTPRQIAALARKGVRTVVNLRGERDCAAYLAEVEACRRHGIELVNYPIRSREPPSREAIEGLADLFGRIDYPALIHCKVGSDRAGMMSALYLLVAEGRSPEEAQRQLSLRYGHVRQSKAGVLDAFFDEYRAHRDRTGEDFMTWVRTAYDPVDMKARFRSRRWADVLYDDVLRRE